MVKKLIDVIPPGGRPYCEPYCGGASLFFARDPAPVEVLNDLNGLVINLFRCLQNSETFKALKHRLTYTLYSRQEFVTAIDICKKAAMEGFEMPDDNIAWALFVAQNQGFGGNDATKIGPGDWGRVFTTARGMASTCSRWNRRIDSLEFFHDRLKRVQIDHIDALTCIRYWDNPEAVFYIDPPYIHDTRVNKRAYLHEANNEHHVELVRLLLGLKGKAVLSGYEHPIYDPLLEAGWKVVKWQVSCYAAGRVRGSKIRGCGAAATHVPRIECAYIKP